MRPATIGSLLALAAVATMSLTLRPGATSPGPLVDPILEFYGVGESAAGALTALPALSFGLLGLIAVPIARRAGLTGAIVGSYVLVIAGLLLRPAAPGFGLFLLLSVLALMGPALANVLVPAWIKQHGGSRTVVLMTLYSTLLAVGGASGSGLAVPLMDAAGGSWQNSLRFWGLASAVPLLVWVLVLVRVRHDFPVSPPRGELHGSLLRSPTALAMIAMFALQSMNAYTQFGLLPTILVADGVSAHTAGYAAAVISLWGIVGGLVMPFLVARSRHLPWISAGLGLLTAAGYIGLLAMPGTVPFFWASVLGIGGFCFPTVIALIPGRSRDALVTARLSGLVQPVGYLGAGTGSLLAGWLLEAAGSTAMMVMMALSGVALAVCGSRASARRMVDDEIA